MDFATGFAAGLAFGKKKFGGGSDEEWKPPSDWPDVPEPADYEMCLLILTEEDNQTVNCQVSDPISGLCGLGNLTIDWGDGTVIVLNDEEWDLYDLYHTYISVGKYVVKIFTTKDNCVFEYFSNFMLLIAKLGDEILLKQEGSSATKNSPFDSHSRLKYVKFGGKGGIPDGLFYGDHGLQRVDITIPLDCIPQNAFTYADSLTQFDFSEVKTVENKGIYLSGFDHIYMPKCQCVNGAGISSNDRLTSVDLPSCTNVSKMSGNYHLIDVNIPSCTTLGDYAFGGDRSLTKLIVAPDCKFGKNCFQGCDNLIPKPDGTL